MLPGVAMDSRWGLEGKEKEAEGGIHVSDRLPVEP